MPDTPRAASARESDTELMLSREEREIEERFLASVEELGWDSDALERVALDSRLQLASDERQRSEREARRREKRAADGREWPE